ncbi:Peptidase M49 dipeptidyl-peptidase III [Lasiodiplodia theobromae]|uniref:Dipeptidyl peptidase iii n=1 Tax=Lasiodiplodia theobromae TaxID=45133 RepID=UPI0015C3075D|nr:Dipeptidyl peptidase iii [Lasiodiplodia theobromae]KAF4534336.1 Dipeptidyl peptidase iii [Lasiodiplodia theobromae]KAF9640099.1 Peptidase M49 dipeptidyl-peptidase III [Lasiodiplodia theobromae]
MDPEALKHYLADSPPTVVPLAIKPHFEALNDQQKLYSHYLSMSAYPTPAHLPVIVGGGSPELCRAAVHRQDASETREDICVVKLSYACFAGTRIVLRQISPESEHIYDFIVTLHRHYNGDWKKAQKDAGLSDDELNAFLDYAAQFLGNAGNYKSFGDSKFIPRLESRQLKALATLTPESLQLYEKFKNDIFADKHVGTMHLGYPDAGHLSTYYPDSPDITKEEITIISDFLENKRLLPENTRIRKTKDGFDVLIASSLDSPSQDQRDIKESEWELDGKLKGKKLKLVFGDYSKEMATIADAIKKARQYASNDTEKSMLDAYEKSFTTGSLEAYKDSQRFWIRDKGPMVETDIGFVETYRDPHGIRGEWEGFVAMVNKERTRAFGKLVEAAPSLIPRLPWEKEFEKDKFLSPDFTSLEVLTFAGSGIPAGINIPNYDDIRQKEGFKNVSLGNVLSAKAPNEKIPFIKDSDDEVYRKFRDPAFEVQVGLHELLGHGCGKLLQETSPGEYNFDIKNPPISPLTNKPITTWYKPGQTWGSVFGPVAASYEECRAECVAMALSCDFDILKIFGFGSGETDINGEAGDVLYAGYLSMARAGVAALEFWDPKSRKWGQAHMQARFSILRVFLNAGKEFCELEYTKDDLSDLTIRLERSKILSLGRPAVEKYLQQLHIYKATADVENGTKMYNDITHVDDFFADKVRPVVLAKKQPRKVFVQANTVVEGDKVALKEYEATAEGMIQSYADREYI